MSAFKILAEDLAERLSVTVQYGYEDDLFIVGISKGDYAQIQLGTIEKASTDIWQLNDLYYLDKIKDPATFAGKVGYEFYDINYYDRHLMQIFKYTFEPNVSYDSRWWNFCKHFKGEFEDLNEVDFHRKCVHTVTKKLGGDTAIYFDDQGPSAKVYLLEEHATLSEIHNQLQQDFGEDYLNISAFLQANNRKPPKAPNKEYIAFYDDFIGLFEH